MEDEKLSHLAAIFEKQKYMSLCKQCNHWICHITEVSWREHADCGCLKYIPSDNLEYLEWCYEENQRREFYARVYGN